MSYTCKHLTLSELDELIDSKDFERIYDDSKAYIENGNYIYNSDTELSDEDKLDHWVSIMRSFSNSDIIDKSTYTHYCLATYKDNVLCMMSACYFDSADNSYNYCHALVGKIDGSKAYSFTTDFFTPQATLMKSVGADKMVFWSTQGGSLSFRAITAQGSPALFDYDNHVQTEEEEVYDIDSEEVNVIPTEDGSTKAAETIKILQQATTTIKTVRPLK